MLEGGAGLNVRPGYKGNSSGRPPSPAPQLSSAVSPLLLNVRQRATAGQILSATQTTVTPNSQVPTTHIIDSFNMLTHLKPPAMTGAPLLKWLVAFCALGSVAVDASEFDAIPASMTKGGQDNMNANPFLVMPYCTPGAACWPKTEVWSAFNQSIGGMLHGAPGRRPS